MTHTSLTFALPVRGLFILDAAFLRAWLEPKRMEVEPRFGDGHIQTGEYIQGRRYLVTPVDPSVHIWPCGLKVHILETFPSAILYVRLTHSLVSLRIPPISQSVGGQSLLFFQFAAVRPHSASQSRNVEKSDRPIVFLDSWP